MIGINNSSYGDHNRRDLESKEIMKVRSIEASK